MKPATKAQHEHWERGQGIADGFAELASQVSGALPGINHPLTTQLCRQVGELRDFLADSHLPGENSPDQPKNPYADFSYQERRILHARDRGVSHADLAEKFEISEGWVREIESRAREKLARDQPKDCGGSGEIASAAKLRPSTVPCGGCNHPDSPNRDQAKGADRG